MNKKQIIFLAAILGVLVVLAVLKKATPRQELYSQETESLEIAVDGDSLDGIRLQKGSDDDSIIFERQESIWRIRSLWNVRADEDKINRLIDEINQLRGELRSNTEELFSDFGITDDMGLHIELLAGESPQFHLIVGLENTDWQNIFVRQAGKSAVYLVNSDLLSVMGFYDLKTDVLDATKWTNLKLFRFETADVAMASLNEGEVWSEIWGNLPFDSEQTKITKYLNDLRNLRGNEVVDPDADSYGLDSPAWKFKLTFDDQSEQILNVGIIESESSNINYVHIEGASEIFIVSEYTLSRIKVDSSRFIKDDPLAIGTANPTTLTVENPEKQVTIALDEDEERSEDLKEYILGLTEFMVTDIKDSPDASVTMPNRLHIVFKEKETVTITCESLTESVADSVNCKQQNQVPFAIKRPTFEAIFQNLDRLQGVISEASDTAVLSEAAP